jgi:hypothetical protein
MKSARKRLAIGVIVVAGLACGAVLLSQLFADPVEQRVHNALRQPSSGPYGNYWLSVEARQEIKALGTNALPSLIRAIDQTSGDSKLDKWIRRRNLDSRLRRFGYMPRWEIREHVFHSFRELGHIAEAAVPALTTSLCKDQTAWISAMCLIEIGSESAVATLEGAARNGGETTRAAAKEALRTVEQTCSLTPPSL